MTDEPLKRALTVRRILSEYGLTDAYQNRMWLSSAIEEALQPTSQMGDAEIFRTFIEQGAENHTYGEGVPYIKMDTSVLYSAVRAILSRATPAPSGDYPEDADKENGNYSNKCASCGKVFTGHKRRVACKVCATPAGADLESIEKALALAFMKLEAYGDAAASDMDKALAILNRIAPQESKGG